MSKKSLERAVDDDDADRTAKALASCSAKDQRRVLDVAWGALEHRPARALQLYAWVARLPEPEDSRARGDWLTAFNNGCIAAFRGGDDDDERLWMAREGMRRGRHNVDIFHNAACAFCALGRTDDALSAVEQAARYGYDQLAGMAGDADLDPIRNLPAYREAIARGRKGRTPDEVIDAWTYWAHKHSAYPGDTFPSDTTDVHFWFASETPEANRVFRQLASTGDGSLLALWSEKDGTNPPVVFLGNEGDVQVLADDVPGALAIVAAAGDENLDSMVSHGGETDDNELGAWLREHFDVSPPADVRAAIAAAAARHPGLADVVARLNGRGQHGYS